MMSRQEALRDMIQSLREDVPDVQGVMVVTSDGQMVVHDFKADALRMAVMAATALGVVRHMTRTIALGEFHEAVFHGNEGYLLLYSAGDTEVLAVAASTLGNLGLIHLEARSLVQRLMALREELPVHQEPDKPLTSPDLVLPVGSEARPAVVAASPTAAMSFQATGVAVGLSEPLADFWAQAESWLTKGASAAELTATLNLPLDQIQHCLYQLYLAGMIEPGPRPMPVAAPQKPRGLSGRLLGAFWRRNRASS